MGRPPISSDTKSTIANIYEGRRKRGERVTAKAVYQEMRKRFGRLISERTVSALLRDFKTKGLPPESSWAPWADDLETPEDTAFLLDLDFVFRLNYGRQMYSIEAKWGRLLSELLQDIAHPIIKLFIVSIYALRERRSELTDQPLITEDLDLWLVVRLKHGANEYDKLLKSGFLPPPPSWAEIETAIESEGPRGGEIRERFKQLVWQQEGDALSALANLPRETLDFLHEGSITIRSMRPDSVPRIKPLPRGDESRATNG